uniref:Uncharacterized protein n=1 Tax=Anguilla anguilla TaxID=7936 RepID=A0A0E9RBS7_ANGAN
MVPRSSINLSSSHSRSHPTFKALIILGNISYKCVLDFSQISESEVNYVHAC